MIELEEMVAAMDIGTREGSESEPGYGEGEGEGDGDTIDGNAADGLQSEKETILEQRLAISAGRRVEAVEQRTTARATERSSERTALCKSESTVCVLKRNRSVCFMSSVTRVSFEAVESKMKETKSGAS